MDQKPTASQMLDTFKRNLKICEAKELALETSKSNGQKEETTCEAEHTIGAETLNKNEQNLSANNSIASTSSKGFYTKAQTYWSGVAPTVDGMLGGLGYISAIDIQGSSVFLRNFKMDNKRALDCGAGIGRVSKELLCTRFLTVDMVEQDTAFANKARQLLAECYPARLGQVYNVGLQQFIPDADAYDLIWSQWVLGHLTDNDLLEFFMRIKTALHKQAYFIVKENVTSTVETVFDAEDSSVTRPLIDYQNILQKAGFRIVKVQRQINFPKGLFPVYMIACKPND